MQGQHFALPPLSIYVTHTHTLSLSMRFRDVDDVFPRGQEDFVLPTSFLPAPRQFCCC